MIESRRLDPGCPAAEPVSLTVLQTLFTLFLSWLRGASIRYRRGLRPESITPSIQRAGDASNTRNKKAFQLSSRSAVLRPACLCEKVRSGWSCTDAGVHPEQCQLYWPRKRIWIFDISCVFTSDLKSSLNQSSIYFCPHALRCLSD